MPSTKPPAPKACADCGTPLPPGSRKTYCDADRDRRKALRNRDNALAWRQRQADARTARQVAARGTATWTPVMRVPGSRVVELKLLMVELAESHAALKARDHADFPFMAELHDHVDAVEKIMIAMWDLLPATEPTPRRRR